MGFDRDADVADSGIRADIDNSPTLFVKKRHTLYIHGGGVHAGEGKEFGRGAGDIGRGKAQGAADAVTVNDHPRDGIRITKEAVGILYPSLFNKMADT